MIRTVNPKFFSKLFAWQYFIGTSVTYASGVITQFIIRNLSKDSKLGESFLERRQIWLVTVSKHVSELQNA